MAFVLSLFIPRLFYRCLRKAVLCHCGIPGYLHKLVSRSSFLSRQREMHIRWNFAFAQLLILYCTAILGQIYPNITDYYRWTVKSGLYCPYSCKENIDYVEQECCACHAKPCWEIIRPGECGVTISDLHIEYTGMYIKRSLSVHIYPKDWDRQS